LLTWLPLLLLSAWKGSAMGDHVQIPFLHDFSAYARFWIALPLLIIADPIVDSRFAKMAGRSDQSPAPSDPRALSDQDEGLARVWRAGDKIRTVL
jgi:hypothetical protein